MPQRPSPTSALYVRLPAPEAAKLDRAAQALGIHKKDLVAGLVSRYVRPDDRQGMAGLAELAAPRRTTVDGGESEVAVGTYSFHQYELPEVLTPEQAAQLLQVAEEVVIGLAESGKLPGRKLSDEWRFSKAGIIAWLETSDGSGRASTKT